MNTLEILKQGHLTVLGAVDGLADADWEQPGVCGSWSVKNIVAHLGSYELVLVDVLTTIVDDGPTPCLDEIRDGPAEFNDRQVAQRAGRNVVETLDEYAAAHERVMELAARVPHETGRQVGTLPWYGADYALDDLIVYMYYGHKREHCAQIALFRDRLT